MTGANVLDIVLGRTCAAVTAAAIVAVAVVVVAAAIVAESRCIVVNVDAGVADVEIWVPLLPPAVADGGCATGGAAEAAAAVLDVTGWRGRPRAELRSRQWVLTMGSASVTERYRSAEDGGREGGSASV